MTKSQQILFSNLRQPSHLGRIMGIHPAMIADKLKAIAAGKSPMIGVGTKDPRLFEPEYKKAQIQLWQDLIVISTEQLKELGVENENKTTIKKANF